MGNHGINTIIIAFGILFVLTNTLALGMHLKIGEILEHFINNWKFAVRVLVINFVILPALIIGFAALVHIPADIKIGCCIVALAAGAPFAPLLTRLAKGDVAMSTTLFVALIVGTVIAVPLALSPAVTALVPSVKHIRIWSVAWPLLLFVLSPLILGCILRLRYHNISEYAVKPLQFISIASLLMYVNIFITANLHLFGQAWGSGTYLAAIAVPVIGIVFGSLIVLKNIETRHASVITAAQRSIGGAIIVTIFNYPQPLANVAVTIINTTGIIILLILSLEWDRAYSKLYKKKTTNLRKVAP